MSLDFRNTNTLWASVLVETLARLGLATAVISPGSRSTPLTVAFAAHSGIEVLPVLDERSAGFFALGLAKRSGLPVVLVCTSGTAGANYFPAVVEARESRVPLLLLTADRPPELRNCASGQTIDQQRLFGHFAHAYAELAVPMADVGMLRYLRQTLVHLWHQARCGPVQINCPFRDPLAPVADGSTAGLDTGLTPAFFDRLDPMSVPVPPVVQTPPPTDFAPRGLIVVGPTPPGQAEFCQAIGHLSQALNWPVLAEGLSPLRSYGHLNANLIATYDLLLRSPDWAQKLVPDQVIQVGPLPTSKVLRQWLARADPQRWILEACDRNLDPLHGRARPAGRLTDWRLALPLVLNSERTYLDAWLELERQGQQQLASALASQTVLVESKVPWLLAHHLPPQTPVVVANSLAVRDVEWFWPVTDRGYEIHFSRGANGIDGTLSTALGIAHRHRPTVLLSGDLALLHDTNGFLSAAQLQGHLTVVVVNNQGGGIFERLPIAQFEPPFEALFATPQRVNIGQLCAAYGVDHELVQSWEQLGDRLRALPTTGVRVLEVGCDRKVSHRYRQGLLNLWVSEDRV